MGYEILLAALWIAHLNEEMRRQQQLQEQQRAEQLRAEQELRQRTERSSNRNDSDRDLHSKIRIGFYAGLCLLLLGSAAAIARKRMNNTNKPAEIDPEANWTY